MKRQKFVQKKEEKKEQEEPRNILCHVVVGCIFLLSFVAIIVAITYPYPHTDYYRDAKLLKGDTLGRINCTIGERYDSYLDICAPLPQSFLPELVDDTVGACESFFKHMSGNWIKSHKNENRAFTYVYRKNQKYIHDIIRDPTSGYVYTFYRSCLDTIVHHQHVMIDNSQVRHVKEHILGALKTHGDLPIIFARLAAYGFTSPFLFTIEPHPTELKMIPLIRRDYMFNITAENSYELNECLKKLSNWIVEDENFEGTYIEYLQTRFKRDLLNMGTLLDGSPPNFWKMYLRELNGYNMEEDIDISTQPVWITDKQYLQLLLHRLSEISVKEWKAYVEHSIDFHTQQHIPDLPEDSYFRIHNPVNGRFRHRSYAFQGDKNDHACMDLTQKLLPGTIGNIFLNKHMKNYEIIKKQVKEVVENVRDAFADMIHNTSWLSANTKEKVADKLQNIIVRVVHPNFYEEEAIVTRITIDSYLRNINIIRRYLATRNFELWTKGEPNRDLIQRFGSPITTVNAFYSPVTNTITIFAGILTEPFYSSTFKDVELYATIGMISAHEIGHALDNVGRLFDKDGSFMIKDSWTMREIEEFEKRKKSLMEEYEAPFGCINAKYGEQTIGEDLSDLNGLTAALWAYKKRGGKDFASFFKIFTQLWSETYDLDIYCDRVSNDEHAISMFRVDKTLRQMKEFKDTFHCSKKDLMVNPNRIVMYGE